jgi:hypothetical protein
MKSKNSSKFKMNKLYRKLKKKKMKKKKEKILAINAITAKKNSKNLQKSLHPLLKMFMKTINNSDSRIYNGSGGL